MKKINRWFWDEGVDWLILAILCLSILGMAVGCKKKLPTSPKLFIATCSASVTKGEAPLLVQFTGNAHGGRMPYSYHWDFGDGEESELRSVSHTYQTVGEYIVAFTVTDNQHNQADASINIEAIESSAQLVVSCLASVTEGEAPLWVTFTGNVDGGTSPYIYHWDFGDGHSSDLQNPEHEYLQYGNYIVTFTVTDSKDVQANASLTIKLYSVHKIEFVARVYVQINVEWSDAFLYNLYCDGELIASITRISYRSEYGAVVGEVTGSIWGLYPGQHTFTFELVESLWDYAYQSRAYLQLQPIDTAITIVPTEMDTGGNFEWEVGDSVEFVFTIIEN